MQSHFLAYFDALYTLKVHVASLKPKPSETIDISLRGVLFVGVQIKPLVTNFLGAKSIGVKMRNGPEKWGL